MSSAKGIGCQSQFPCSGKQFRARRAGLLKSADGVIGPGFKECIRRSLGGHWGPAAEKPKSRSVVAGTSCTTHRIRLGCLSDDVNSRTWKKTERTTEF